MQLREYRTEKGLTLMDVADLVGWGFNKVSRHERGAVTPSIEEIEKYRKLTGGAVRHEDWLELTMKVARRSSSASTAEKEKSVA